MQSITCASVFQQDGQTDRLTWYLYVQSITYISVWTVFNHNVKTGNNNRKPSRQTVTRYQQCTIVKTNRRQWFNPQTDIGTMYLFKRNTWEVQPGCSPFPKWNQIGQKLTPPLVLVPDSTEIWGYYIPKLFEILRNESAIHYFLAYNSIVLNAKVYPM